MALSEGGILKLINKGNQLLRTQTMEEGSVGPYPVVNTSMYSTWRSQVLNYSSTFLTVNSQYHKGLENSLRTGAYPSNVETAIGHLKALIEDIENGIFGTPTPIIIEPLNILSKILDKFHNVVMQLRRRHDDRGTIDVGDEYDVQDLLHALLKLNFDDIQPEDWTPSYAGNSSRVDFVLREFGMLIEVKKTRPNLKNKQLADQLIIDIERYRTCPYINQVVCFVYDPDGYISNPRGFENDFNRDRDGINVIVTIRPKH